MYACKNCQGMYNFPAQLTEVQARLHKRKHPGHTVVMILPANIGMTWTTKQLKEVKK